MSMSGLKRLTLVYPPEIETELVEQLLAMEPPLPGFTSLTATGHGADFSVASVRERVRGRVDRCVLFMVLPSERVQLLLHELKRATPAAHVHWWIEPVEEFGSFL
jgi:hypothetical protein